MNFLKTFLSLIEYTTPFGYEHTLEKYLPVGYQKDNWGNYYYEIGFSKTIFTAHLDNATDKYEKVNYIIKYNGNGDLIISTDKKTILGADNKAGCLILFYMIERKVPGLYYFFVGEESNVHKNLPYGSLMVIENEQQKFIKYDKVISFDRKETGQLVTRQIGRECCSDMFANQLINKFSKLGISLYKDNTGYYTDSAFFIDIIPEIVNISCGVYNEHTVNEYVNINYVIKTAIACCDIEWDSLVISTNRKFNILTCSYKDDKFLIDSRKDTDTKDFIKTENHILFEKVFNIFDDLYYYCHEIRNYNNYLENFKEERVYHFTKWHEDETFAIKIIDKKIHVYKYLYNLNTKVISTNKTNSLIYWFNGAVKFDNIDDFKKYLGFEKIDNLNLLLTLKKEFSENKITDAKFNYILMLKQTSREEVTDLFKKTGFNLFKIGKGYELSRL